MSFYGGWLTELTSITPEFAGDPKKGRSWIRQYQGTPSQIQLTADTFDALRIRYEVRNAGMPGGYQIITAFFGASENANPDEPLADIWSINGNNIEKSLWESPKVQAETIKLGTFGAAQFRQAVEAYLSGSADKTLTQVLSLAAFVEDPDLGLIDTGADLEVLKKLIGSLSRGVEAKLIPQYVVQRVLVLPPNTNLEPAHEGVGEVITLENFLAGGDPGAANIDPVVKRTLENPKLKQRFLLKLSPTMTQPNANNENWEIRQEWWTAEEYDAFTYDQYGQ
jgi:hypothetical protein